MGGDDQTRFGETGGLSQSMGMTSSQSMHQAAGASMIEEDEVPKKAPTVPKPFNLTRPKPKVIPQPEAMPREVKSNPVPKGLFKRNL